MVGSALLYFTTVAARNVRSKCNVSLRDSWSASEMSLRRSNNSAASMSLLKLSQMYFAGQGTSMGRAPSAVSSLYLYQCAALLPLRNFRRNWLVDGIFMSNGVKAVSGNWSIDGYVMPSSCSPDNARTFVSRALFVIPVRPIPVPMPYTTLSFLDVPGTAARKGTKCVSNCILFALFSSVSVYRNFAIASQLFQSAFELFQSSFRSVIVNSDAIVPDGWGCSPSQY